MKFALQLLILLLSLPVAASAQTTFTAHVRKQGAGDGKVVIVQDAQIDKVVNNGGQAKPAAKPAAKPVAKDTPKKPATPPNSKSTTPEHKNAAHEKATSEAAQHRHPVEHADTTDEPAATHIVRQRYRAQGYRIQIFTGSNSHQDKMQAYAIGKKCQKRFPMLSVYPRFVNPRWICRVGDFRTYADAQEYVNKIKAARISREVRIVKCEVLLAR